MTEGLYVHHMHAGALEDLKGVTYSLKLELQQL